MTEISTGLLENLPELNSLLNKEEISVIEYLNNLFAEFTNNKSNDTNFQLSLSDYMVDKIAINRKKIDNENLLFIGAFFALWKGKVSEYEFIKNRLSKEKINYYNILCLENLFHIICSGMVSIVNQNLETIKIYLEKHGIGESKVRSRLLINYFGIKSFLFDLKGNDIKCNQFYTFALREASNQQLDADSLIIPTILRILLLLETDIDRAHQLCLDLIDTVKLTENRFLISIAQLILGKSIYSEKNSITAYNIYNNLKKRLTKLQAAPLLLLLNIQLGNLEYLVGKTKKALDIYKSVISKATIASMPRLIVLGLRHLGDIYLLQLNLNVSQDLYEKALIITRKIHDNANKAYCLQQLGSIYLAQKNYVEAHKAFLESLELIENFKIRRLNLTFELGQLFLNLKDELNIKMVYQLMRTDIQKIGTHSQLIIFNAQKTLFEKQYDLARELLEDMYNKKEKLSSTALINVLLLLFQLDLINFNQEKDEIILEDAEVRLEEVYSHCKKLGYGGLTILVLVLKALWIYLYTEKNELIFLNLLTNAWELAEASENDYIYYLAKRYERKLKRVSKRIDNNDLEEIIFFIQRMIHFHQNSKDV